MSGSSSARDIRIGFRVKASRAIEPPKKGSIVLDFYVSIHVTKGVQWSTVSVRLTQEVGAQMSYSLNS